MATDIHQNLPTIGLITSQKEKRITDKEKRKQNNAKKE
jgi:hypothetical protein